MNLGGVCDTIQSVGGEQQQQPPPKNPPKTQDDIWNSETSPARGKYSNTC